MPSSLFRHEKIVFRQFSEPFSLDDLFLLNRSDVISKGAQADLNGPLLEDFSKVDLRSLTAKDIQRYVGKVERAEEIPRRISNNYVACIAKDLNSFAKLRMYGVYSEIAGVRDEENLFVTEDYQDGIHWLTAKIGLGRKQGQDLWSSLRGTGFVSN